ncbi:hypothetical protein EC957_010591 [Mortierella hygrophila]|uniref:Uncharacterized protein n=1 Tax=Mortierella hygrophila TaxID=979708 RepID=A0A9P6F8W6_9FUNG|nr:hypothetical protein EC957_010591 [Mortierella hygrophila]
MAQPQVPTNTTNYYSTSNPGYPTGNPGYPTSNPGYPTSNPGYPTGNPGNHTDYPTSSSTSYSSSSTSYSSSYSSSHSSSNPTWTSTRTHPPGTTYTSSPGSSDGSGDESTSIVGAVIGGVVGGLVLIALLAGFFVMRQRKRRNEANKRDSDTFEGRSSTEPITATTGVGSGGNGSGGEGIVGSQKVPYVYPEREYQQQQQPLGNQYDQEHDPYYAQHQRHPQDYYVEDQSYHQSPQFIPAHESFTESTSPAMTQITTAGSNLAYCPPPFVPGPGSFERRSPGAPHTIIDDPSATKLPTTKNPQALTDDPFTIPMHV